MKTPAYAKAKTITSLSGGNATYKHIKTLQRAQMLLIAQGDEASRLAAMAIGITIANYRRELQTFYESEHYPYRTPENALSVDVANQEEQSV